MQLRTTTCLSVLAIATWLPAAFAQNAPPQAPTAQQAPAAPPAARGAVCAGPTPRRHFPQSIPSNFTAASPTRQTVEDFLHAYWGYDSSRIWQVQDILPTPAPGVSRVLVLVRSTGGGPKDQTSGLSFFTLPDGKFLVADSLLPFGAKPFQSYREILQAGANGPSKGGASKAMEFVEFSDFECPHCKEAQPIVAKLLADYPSAHFVYQDYPLTHIHTEAFKASTHAYCVAKTGGNDAFFKFCRCAFRGAGRTYAGHLGSNSEGRRNQSRAGPGQDCCLRRNPRGQGRRRCFDSPGRQGGSESNTYPLRQWARVAHHRYPVPDAAEDHRVPGATGWCAAASGATRSGGETGSLVAIAIMSPLS